MSLESVAYALEQQIYPQAHLALIVIADGLGDTFKLDEAAEILLRRTRIKEKRIPVIIQYLLKHGHIRRWLMGNTSYCVPVYEPPPFPAMMARSSPKIIDTSGFVYLLQSPTNAYKIGKTINPASRYLTFKTALPFEVEYICIIKTDNMHVLEIELHERFSDRRINGEWFKLTDEDVEYIKGLANG